MKKQARILTIINAGVILLLLIISAIMFFMIGSSSKNIFGQQVKLIIDDNQDAENGSEYLVFIKPKDVSELAAGGYFIYTSNEIEFIAKADSVENNIISYTDKKGETATISADSREYGGRITSASSFWGSVFSAIAGKENISLSFILIGGIFIVSMLSLVIIYVINTHTSAKRYESNGGEVQEIIPAEVEEKSAPPAESTAVLVEIADPPAELAAPVAEELAFPQPVINIAETKNFGTIDFEEIMSEIADYEKLFEKPQRLTAEPQYQLAEENVPSIDSLIASIDKQFDVSDDDGDIKIFDTKK